MHGQHLHLASWQPADTDDLVKLFLIVDRHGLIVVFLDDLLCQSYTSTDWYLTRELVLT